jgi:hypothetical protein
MTVISLDEHRRRKTPAWNPETKRHAWLDIDEDGHHHKCLHCWVAYHSEPTGSGGYVKVWSHGARSGRSTSLGKCPGPSGRPALEVVADEPVLEVPAASGGAVPDRPVGTPLCRRCNPPCGRPGRLHLGGVSCAEVVAAEGAATREWIRDMRSSGGAA